MNVLQSRKHMRVSSASSSKPQRIASSFLPPLIYALWTTNTLNTIKPLNAKNLNKNELRRVARIDSHTTRETHTQTSLRARYLLAMIVCIAMSRLDAVKSNENRQIKVCAKRMLSLKSFCVCARFSIYLPVMHSVSRRWTSSGSHLTCVLWWRI